jgi:hypothetical protein
LAALAGLANCSQAKRDMRMTHGRSGGITAIAATAAIGLAACSGSSSPRVASLGNSGGNVSGVTTTTLPKGNPTELVDEWASCMHSHGDPNQVDPTIDANKVIHITFPPGAGNGPGSLGGVSGSCSAYLTAASTALRGGKPPQKPDPAKMERFSQCMRAHGIPDFPDPGSGGLSLQSHPGSDLSPNNPTFQNAAKLCVTKTGVPFFVSGTPQPGTIEATGGGGPQGGPGGNGGTRTNSVGVAGG